jgi:hypothetical protein
MPKEIENKVCVECGSQFRIIFEPHRTSGYPKFCCFCSECIIEEDNNEEELLDDFE